MDTETKMAALPVRVVRDDLWLCVDCTIVAVNGDTSGIDSEERVAAVTAGLERLGPHLVSDHSGQYEDGHEEFMPAPLGGCACCRSPLAGEFWRFAVLGT